MVKKFTLLLHLLFHFSFILCVNSFNPGISKSQQRWLGLGTQGQTPVICSLRRVGGFSANCSLILPFSALTSQLVLLLWGCLSYWLPWIYHCYVYPSFTLHKGLSMYQLIPLHKQPVNLRRVMVCPKINSLQVNSRVSLVQMHHGLWTQIPDKGTIGSHHKLIWMAGLALESMWVFNPEPFVCLW